MFFHCHEFVFIFFKLYSLKNLVILAIKKTFLNRYAQIISKLNYCLTSWIVLAYWARIFSITTLKRKKKTISKLLDQSVSFIAYDLSYILCWFVIFDDILFIKMSFDKVITYCRKVFSNNNIFSNEVQCPPATWLNY